MSLPQTYQPVAFSGSPEPFQDGRLTNWSIAPDVLENEVIRIVDTGEDKPEKAKATEHGVSGPKRAVVYFPALDKKATFKWKVAPDGKMDNFNNSIAREMASYQLQKIYLEPEEYVVPTSFALCYQAIKHTQNVGEYEPQVEGSECVFGNAALWLENVEIPEQLFDESRFLNEPVYAYYMSNFNILTYLLDHRDARSANYLVSKNDQDRHVFMIDNSTTFGAYPYNFFVHNWNVIRVPALRKASINKLRQLQRADLDYLGVVAQLNKDDDNIFKNKPAGKNMDPDLPVRITANQVQFGLTRQQIDEVWERINALIEDVDSGKIPTF